MSITGGSQFPETGETVAAIFSDRTQAEDALRELRANGFRPEEIGVAMRDIRDARELAQTVAETEVEEGAAIGAAAGGALGGIAGWLVGVGALLIPGVGPIVAAGPLAVALGALVIGAATGGLVGALVGEGIPEENARWYEEAIRAGYVLITVRAGDRATRAREVLRESGGVEARQPTGPVGHGEL